MPIIEFRCASCGNRFEELMRSAEPDGPVCPSCSGKDLERLFSVFGVQVARGSEPSSPCEDGGSCGMGGGCCRH